MGRALCELQNESYSMLKISNAQLEHSNGVFVIANHPDIRAVSFQTKNFTIDEHNQWFSAIISDKSTLFLVAVEDNSVVGYIRFTKILPELVSPTASISIAVFPGLSGKGIGTQLIKSGIVALKKTWPEIQLLKAEVKISNKASQRFFLANGFKEVPTSLKDRKEFSYAV